MKKLFSILMLTAMVFCVSSCGSDEDDPTPEKAAYASVAANYYLEFSDQMLAFCEITAKYTNENGETITEAITANTWNTQVMINKPASQVSLQVYLSKKDGVDYTENSPYVKTGPTGNKYFDISLSDASVSAVTYDAKGKEIAKKSSQLGSYSLNVGIDKIDQLFDPSHIFRQKNINISESGEIIN